MSPRTIHFWVLDKNPVSGPGRGPPSCNTTNQDFSGSSDGKEFAANVGDLGSILGWEDPLENRMATHSSILAWRIPQTEERGGL